MKRNHLANLNPERKRRAPRSRLGFGSILLCGAVGFVALSFSYSGKCDAKVRPRRIDPADFVALVDNPFFPLSPGTTFHFTGTRDGIPTRTETFVTHDVKQILGVNCTVVHDQVYENDVLTEDTYDWYAQDVDGNVWYMGEDTKELDAEGNIISTEGSFEAGVNGALPGIIMEAHPRIGDRYFQEHARGVAEDQAEVLSLDASVCVAYGGCHDHLLLTKEWTRLERGVVEHKYYLAGVGVIKVVTVKGGNEEEELESVEP